MRAASLVVAISASLLGLVAGPGVATAAVPAVAVAAELNASSPSVGASAAREGYRDPPNYCIQCHMWNGSGADTNGHLLSCLCPPEDTWSTVHLNLYIRNENGALAWGGNGHRATCRTFVLHDQRYYQATCEDLNHEWKFSQIDLNNHITIYNSRLHPEAD